MEKQKDECYCQVVKEGGWCLYYGLGKSNESPGIMCKSCKHFNKNTDKVAQSNHIDF